MPDIRSGEYGELDEDELAVVTAYLDDPRVQAFNPLGWKTQLSEEGIKAAYEFLSQKPEWLAKAYFYPDGNDEPMTRAQLNSVIENAKLIKSVWEDYKLIIPMHWNDLIDSKTGTDHFEYLKEYVNVWCPHTFFFNTIADQKANKKLTVRVKNSTEKKLGTFPDRMAKEQAEGDEVWWYVTRFPHTPEITLSIGDPEVDHRILFWQQKLYNVDGFLYYSVNDWYGGGASQHNWGWDKKHEVDTGTINPFDFYGNGVLLYHGGYIGRLHECVESIRLESIRDGIEDYDYFDLLDAKYGEGTSTLLIKQITTSLGDYNSDPELFNRIRLAVGDLIAPDPEPEPETTDSEPAAPPDEPTETAGEKTEGKNKTVPIIAAAAAVAALAACVPYRWVTLSGGSPTGFGMGLVPGVALGVDLAVRDRSVRGGLLAGALVLCCYAADLHCFLFSVLALPLWGLVALLRSPDNPFARRRRFLRLCAALSPIALGGAATAALGMLARSAYEKTDVSGGRTLSEIERLSPDWHAFFDPTYFSHRPEQFHMGRVLPLLLTVAGVVLLAAFLAAAIGLIRRRKDAPFRTPAILFHPAFFRRTDRSDAPGPWRRSAFLRTAFAGLLLAAAILFAFLLALGTHGPCDALPLRLVRKLVPPFRMVRQPIKVFCLLPALADSG